MVLSTFFFLLIISFVVSFDETFPPDDTQELLCSTHPHALVGFYNKSGDFDKRKCSLYFNLNIDDYYDLCDYMFPAQLMTAKKTSEHVICDYEFFTVCPNGYLPIHDKCIQISREMATWTAATEKCKQAEGTLPREAQLRDVLIGISPPKLGYPARKYWTDEGKIFIMRRGPHEEQYPFNILPPGEGEEANYYCNIDGGTSERQNALACTVMADAFNLKAIYVKSTKRCYTISTSVYSLDLVNSVAQSAKLHDYCEWLSDESMVASPINEAQEIDALRRNTTFENKYLLTTGRKDQKSLLEGWTFVEKNGFLTPVKNELWASGRPLMEENDFLNTVAILQPKEKRKYSIQLLHDIPHYYRGHLACAHQTEKQTSKASQKVDFL